MSLGFIISLYNYGKYNHFDEWVGRGLYPGIAFAKGFDLYEPSNGPHVTSYGWATALFYSPCGFIDTPNKSIFMAYFINIVCFFGIIYFIISTYIKRNGNKHLIITITATLMIINIALFDEVTTSIAKIHSDAPATIFLITGLLFCSHTKNQNRNIGVGSVFLLLSVMAKLPTLTGLLTPFIVFLTQRNYRKLTTISLFLITFLLIFTALISYLFGFKDFMYYHINLTSNWGWVNRYNLFDGNGAEILNLSYLEAIPLLIRFLLMYFQEYWYFFISNIIILIFSFRCNSHPKRIMYSLCISYFLTLPSCLAALAHWGAYPNSLFICNAIALISVCSFIIYKIHHLLPDFNKLPIIVSFTFISVIVLLVSLRSSLNAPDIENSPQQQAYNYLKNGNKDIYFGWYPISHALHDNSNLTSFEVPIWVGMSRNYDFAFSNNHFPLKANIFATCQIGYGSQALKPFLGELHEIQVPLELSHWRLFKIVHE